MSTLQQNWWQEVFSYEASRGGAEEEREIVRLGKQLTARSLTETEGEQIEEKEQKQRQQQNPSQQQLRDEQLRQHQQQKQQKESEQQCTTVNEQIIIEKVNQINLLDQLPRLDSLRQHQGHQRLQEFSHFIQQQHNYQPNHGQNHLQSPHQNPFQNNLYCNQMSHLQNSNSSYQEYLLHHSQSELNLNQQPDVSPSLFRLSQYQMQPNLTLNRSGQSSLHEAQPVGPSYVVPNGARYCDDLQLIQNVNGQRFLHHQGLVQNDENQIFPNIDQEHFLRFLIEDWSPIEEQASPTLVSDQSSKMQGVLICGTNGTGTQNTIQESTLGLPVLTNKAPQPTFVHKNGFSHKEQPIPSRFPVILPKPAGNVSEEGVSQQQQRQQQLQVPTLERFSVILSKPVGYVPQDSVQQQIQYQQQQIPVLERFPHIFGKPPEHTNQEHFSHKQPLVQPKQRLPVLLPKQDQTTQQLDQEKPVSPIRLNQGHPIFQPVNQQLMSQGKQEQNVSSTQSKKVQSIDPMNQNQQASLGLMQAITGLMQIKQHQPLQQIDMNLQEQQLQIQPLPSKQIQMNQQQKMKQEVSTPGREDKKKKKPRTSFTEIQMQRMLVEFEKNQFLAASTLVSLSEELGLERKVVLNFFQNRRSQQRKGPTKAWNKEQVEEL